MSLWRSFVSQAIKQYVSGRLFAYLCGNAAVIWLALADRLEASATANLLTLLIAVYFGVKGIEWAGNAINSITMKAKGDKAPIVTPPPAQ
jgi:hypothetical protein